MPFVGAINVLHWPKMMVRVCELPIAHGTSHGNNEHWAGVFYTTDVRYMEDTVSLRQITLQK